MAASRNERRWIPRPMIATPKRLPLTISIIRFRPRPSRAASPVSLWRDDPASHALAPSRTTSPVGTPTVPILGFSRRMRNPLGEPSGVMRGTMNVPRPRAPGGAVGHAHGTDQRRLGLTEKVVQGRADSAGHRPPRPPLERRVAVTHQVGLALQPGRVVHDLVGLLAPVVPGAQYRAVLVGDLGPAGNGPAHQGAELAHDVLRQG